MHCAKAGGTTPKEESVKDREGDLVQGGTRWRRFAILAGASTLAVGGIIFGMANGAIAASFAVSGQTFKVQASKLVGTGFVQYGGVASEANGKANHAVAVSGIKSADLYDLCQSVKVPGAPIVLVIKAGGNNNPAHADDLLIDMDSLSGDATFGNIHIGQDAATLDAAGPTAHGAPGAFGQQATDVTILNLQQVARSTSAATFKLTGLNLSVNVGADAKECF
jgi:hypothetical protein